VSYAADRNEKVEQGKDIAKPQTSADRGCVNYGLAKRLKVFCLVSKGSKRRRLAGGGSKTRIPHGGIRRRLWFRVLHFFPHAASLEAELRLDDRLANEFARSGFLR
jgi:hypothetical protein